MLFNSIGYLFFVVIAFLVYHLIPKRIRYVWLLACSYFFYGQWNAKYTLLMLCVTVISYSGAIVIHHQRECPRAKRTTVLISLLLCFGLLCHFKYANFLIENINAIASSLSSGIRFSMFDILLPVGISFYTFQAVGYIIDVYRDTGIVEKNPLRYALFVSFFPQLVAGPIERSANLLHQLERPRRLTGSGLREGLLVILIGLWQKTVIADNIAAAINPVFESYQFHNGLEIAFSTMLFAFQIYCDFAGYSNMAVGSAKLFGIDLMRNFSSPYLATSVPDFWRRWHISLTSWLKDYLYIPLGGNRKGPIRKALNVMIVFFASGVWHGAHWNFIFWGVLNGLLILFHQFKSSCCDHLLGNRPPLPRIWLARLVTFILICFTWLFFRAPSLRAAFGILDHMGHHIGLRDLVVSGRFPLIASPTSLLVIGTSIVLLLFMDLLQEKHGDFLSFLSRRRASVRWSFYLILLLEIIVFGVYGDATQETQFIYFQF